jgi:hypothetical protein
MRLIELELLGVGISESLALALSFELWESSPAFEDRACRAICSSLAQSFDAIFDRWVS